MNAGFNDTFGGTRGALHSLAAKNPTAAAQAQADSLCAEVANGNFDSAVKQLNHYYPRKLTAPLVARVVDALACELHQRLQVEPEAYAFVALYALRLCPHIEPQIIVNYEPSALHLWHGDDFLHTVDTVVTACQRDLVEESIHAKRGDWHVAAFGGPPRCDDCETHASTYPETKDHPEPGLTHELQARLPEVLLIDVHATVVALASREDLEAAKVLELHGIDGRIEAAAVELLRDDRENACIRILHGYSRLRQRSPSDLHLLLEEGDWPDLVSDAFALARAPGAAGPLVGATVDDRLAEIVKQRLP